MAVPAFAPPPVVFHVALPEPRDLARFLTDLIGRDVSVTKLEPALKPAEVFSARMYLHGGKPGEQHPGDGQPAVLMVLDRAASAYLGAALSLVPKGSADESAKGPAWSDLLTENLGEVLNVMTGLFNHGAVRHTVPGPVHAKDGLHKDEQVFSSLARAKASYQVTVSGYGQGRITLFC